MTAIDLQAKTVAGPVIRLHPDDNVVVARVDAGIGTPVPSEGFTLRSQVPAGYKIAARAIRKGEPILKYAVVVGFAATDIPAGTLVHGHNTEFREFDRNPLPQVGGATVSECRMKSSNINRCRSGVERNECIQHRGRVGDWEFSAFNVSREAVNSDDVNR